MKLEELIDKFRNDKAWNIVKRDGSHRFDAKLKWLEGTIREYSEFFNVPADEIATMMEKSRTYSWPNYYQEANFPSVDHFGDLIGIYRTFDEFNDYATQHWKGFKCPKCGTIGSHPQLCIHRLNKDGTCDWSACGLITAKGGVIILESGFKVIPIFEPVPIDADDNRRIVNDDEKSTNDTGEVVDIWASPDKHTLNVKVDFNGTTNIYSKHFDRELEGFECRDDTSSEPKVVVYQKE